MSHVSLHSQSQYFSPTVCETIKTTLNSHQSQLLALSRIFLALEQKSLLKVKEYHSESLEKEIDACNIMKEKRDEVWYSFCVRLARQEETVRNLKKQLNEESRKREIIEELTELNVLLEDKASTLQRVEEAYEQKCAEMQEWQRELQRLSSIDESVKSALSQDNSERPVPGEYVNALTRLFTSQYLISEMMDLSTVRSILDKDFHDRGQYHMLMSQFQRLSGTVDDAVSVQQHLLHMEQLHLTLWSKVVALQEEMSRIRASEFALRTEMHEVHQKISELDMEHARSQQRLLQQIAKTRRAMHDDQQNTVNKYLCLDAQVDSIRDPQQDRRLEKTLISLQRDARWVKQLLQFETIMKQTDTLKVYKATALSETLSCRQTLEPYRYSIMLQVEGAFQGVHYTKYLPFYFASAQALDWILEDFIASVGIEELAEQSHTAPALCENT